MENDSWRHWRAFSALVNPAFMAGSRPAGAADPGFTPWIDAGERFARAAQSFAAAAQGAFAFKADGAPGVAGETGAADSAARAFADSLREQFANLQMPWSAGPNAEGYVPELGAAREHQQRAQRLAAAWRRMEEARTRLQRLWSDALQEAANGFAAELGVKPPAALDPAALREVYDRWIEAAEAAYARAAHGDAFCLALADFVNASSDWRKDQQASIEHWAKQFDLPTRSEVNSLTRRLKAVEAAFAAAPADKKRPRKKPKPQPKPKPKR